MIEEFAHVIDVSPAERYADENKHNANPTDIVAGNLASNPSHKAYQVTVQSQIKSSCGGCAQLDTCGTGQISKALPQRQTRFTVLSTMPVKVGDKVVLGLSEQALLTSAWQVYLWPVIGLIMMASLSQWLLVGTVLSHELYSLFLGLVGAFLAHKLAYHQQNQSACAKKMQPAILRITLD
jgi:sigma-E factor negative regulatory protein RseC